MRIIGLIVTVALLSGCAVIDDPVPAGRAADGAQFEAIDEGLGYERVEHGIVTVSEVHPRSDIVIMPPSVQHVVWQRDTSTMPAAAAPVTVTTKKKEKTQRSASPIDNWPLLAEDLNFESEIGRVDMCQRQDACMPGDSCPEVVPCENADELSCFRAKQGDYCLENE